MYVKLFTRILDSSIWLAASDTRIVWITLLAAMDEDGFCAFASAENVARRANLSVEATKTALAEFEGPDPLSANPDNEGRRIERVPGGWMILNSKVFRELIRKEEQREQTRKRVAAHRRRSDSSPVTDGNVFVTPPSASVSPSDLVTPDAIYAAYPKHVGKAAAIRAIEKAITAKPAAELLAIVKVYAEAVATWPESDRCYVPHPATWFNRASYDDDPSAWRRDGGSGNVRKAGFA